MTFVDFSSQNAKKIRTWDEYPGGANMATVHTEYACLCGKGTVEYVRVPGFDDDYAEIHCKECRERYEIRYGRGSFWSFEEK